MNAKSVTVIATFQARQGKEAELRAALADLLTPTRKEVGCLNYDCHQSADSPAKFLFHENWESQAHLDAHLQSAPIQALSPRVNKLCTELPQITLWEQIG